MTSKEEDMIATPECSSQPADEDQVGTKYNIYLDPAQVPKPAPVHVEKKPGRNEPCSCNSGKKYKKCCGGNTP